MSFRFSSLFSLVAGLALCSSACSQNTENRPSGLPRTDNTDFSVEALTRPAGESWLTNGGSLANQRWSALEQINRNNVGELKGVWRTHLNGSGMGTRNSGEAQPLYHDGVLYTVTGDDDVYAVSVVTGEILWEYRANVADEVNEVICCGWTSRGVALGDGKVFLGRLDSKLVALDMKTGEVIWETTGADWEQGYTITSAPLFFDGMIITGYAGAERGIRGKVDAFNAATGEHVWTFWTIPAPGEIGHDTWPQQGEYAEVWKYGGASVWQTPAIDTDAGLMYFSTGNPGPDFNGYVREGDNLFTASVVAVDAWTGEYRWHYQMVHHDIWDYDAPNPVILFDVEIDGIMRKGLANAPKTGWVYILDRLTGEPLIGIEEKPVPQEPLQKTSATQPHPVGDSFVPQFIDIPPEGVTLINQGRIFTPFTPDQPVMVQPSIAGSANWPPSAYDPERQMMFICAAESGMTINGGGPDMEIPDVGGGLFVGGGIAGPSKPQTGVIAAMDVKTNTLVWQYRWPESCYSGFVATAGDLLFVGRNDGRLTALDTDTGHELWSFQTGAGMNSTVTPFEYDGVQYVAAYSAGNVFAGSYHGDSLWLFSLEGTLEETTEGDTALAATQTVLNDVEVIVAPGPANLAAGDELYRQTCLPCHGEDGLGGHGGGISLADIDDVVDAISVVTRGRNNMPTFYGALTPEQIRDVSVFAVEELTP